MKRILWAVVALSILIATCVPAPGARKRAKPAAPPREEKPISPPSMRVPPTMASFTDDMSALVKQVGLDEKQVAKITALRKRRDEALTRQEQADEKRIESAEARIKQAKRDSDRQRRTRDLDKSIERMKRTLAALAAQHERTMFFVLKPEQKAKWNAPILQSEVEKAFASLGLTDAQRVQIQALCAAQAKRLSLPASPQTASYTIKSLASQVNLRVLTREQKQQYAKDRADRSKPKPRPRRESPRRNN